MSRGHGATQRWALQTLAEHPELWHPLLGLATVYQRRLRAGGTVHEPTAPSHSSVEILRRSLHRLAEEGVVEVRYIQRPVTFRQTLISYTGTSYTQDVHAHRRQLFIRLVPSVDHHG